MTLLGYHASHEQFAPSDLLEFVAMAERSGFDCAHSSDHFHPWHGDQGQSGYAWTWLGAAMQATAMPFSVVSAPGYRYHPAVLAQAIATAAQMFPGRLCVALGSGEALNEGITGAPWPEKAERNARLSECAMVIRALLNGETVTHRGRVRVIEARLYTRPEHKVPLFAAAVTPGTAAEMAGWADGLLTTGSSAQSIASTVDAFRSNGGQGKPVHIQHALSWAPTQAEAEQQALHQWFNGAIGGDAAWQLRTPGQFEALRSTVTLDVLHDTLVISSDLDRQRSRIAELLALDPSIVFLHCVARNQRQFIETFGQEVLPSLRAGASP
jgi:probable non-F420 flavinoid oxidoreductase